MRERFYHDLLIDPAPKIILGGQELEVFWEWETVAHCDATLLQTGCPQQLCLNYLPSNTHPHWALGPHCLPDTEWAFSGGTSRKGSVSTVEAKPDTMATRGGMGAAKLGFSPQFTLMSQKCPSHRQLLSSYDYYCFFLGDHILYWAYETTPNTWGIFLSLKSVLYAKIYGKHFWNKFTFTIYLMGCRRGKPLFGSAPNPDLQHIRCRALTWGKEEYLMP